MKSVLVIVSMILVLATVAAAQSPMGGGDTSLNNPMAAFSIPPGTHGGDDYATAFSPAWLPNFSSGYNTMHSGRWNNGWVQYFAVCTSQPYPGGGRSVGLGMRHYNGCSGFPSGVNSMELDATDDVPYTWTIKGTAEDHNVLDYEKLTFYWRGTSNCLVWQSGQPYVSWITVEDSFTNGC